MLDRNVTPAFRRLIKRTFPELDFKEALSLMRMGLLRLPKKARCGAWARSRKRPCQAQALHNGTGRCRVHGGCSSGCKTEDGRRRISEAQKRRWASWREESG
jgi:hypothetical protein